MADPTHPRPVAPDELDFQTIVYKKAPPRIGIATTIGIIIALNLAVGTAIDRFGWFGYDRIALSGPRLVGLVLLGAGAALSLHK